MRSRVFLTIILLSKPLFLLSFSKGCTQVSRIKSRTKHISLFIQDGTLDRVIACVRACMCTQLCLTLYDPMTVAHQASLFIECSRQEYWSGLPFPTPGDLPDPGIELASLVFPALVGWFFTAAPPGKPLIGLTKSHFSLFLILGNVSTGTLCSRKEADWTFPSPT